MAIFDHAHPKIIESTFNVPEFGPACKKSVYFICSFLRYIQSILEFHDQLATPIFDQAQLKHF